RTRQRLRSRGPVAKGEFDFPTARFKRRCAASRARYRAVLRYSPPATSPGGEEQGDAACNRRPAGYDPKELLSDMIERGELDMQWCDRHCHDKHPKEYSGKDEGYSHSSLADNWLIEWGHRGPLADARVTVVE